MTGPQLPFPAPQGKLRPIARVGSTVGRSAIWRLACECGTEFDVVSRKYRTGKVRCPECFPPVAVAQVKAILAVLPATYKQIAERSGLSDSSVDFRVIVMRRDGQCHVGDWLRTQGVGGAYQPVFVTGPGKDVPCRFKPLSVKERTAKYVAKLKSTDEGREICDIRRARNRALYHAGRAGKRGDPLVAALFGRQGKPQREQA